jgi:hypothetical protein
MEHATLTDATSRRAPAGRLLRVGLLAPLLSASANALVLEIASSVFGPVVIPPDETMTIGRVVVASAGGAVGAVVLFAASRRYARRPIRVFQGVAAAGLLLSFIPIVMAGATGSSAGALATMHTVAAAISVGILTRLDRAG